MSNSSDLPVEEMRKLPHFISCCLTICVHKRSEKERERDTPSGAALTTKTHKHREVFHMNTMMLMITRRLLGKLCDEIQ